MVDSFKSAPLENSNTLGIYKATTETTFEREVTCLSDYLMTSFSTNFVFFFFDTKMSSSKKHQETTWDRVLCHSSQLQNHTPSFASQVLGLYAHTSFPFDFYMIYYYLSIVILNMSILDMSIKHLFKILISIKCLQDPYADKKYLYLQFPHSLWIYFK